MSRGGPSPRYRAVLLDAGETILGPRQSYGAVYSRVFAEMGVHRPLSQFEEALRGAWSAMDEANRKGADRYGSFDGGEDAYWLAFVREAIDRLGVSPVAPIAERALPRLREAFRAPEAWIVWPDVVPVLGTLRRFGVVLGLVSNWDSRLPDLLAALGLRTHFDAFAVSSIEGVEKPAPRLFRIALERLGVAPDEAVHVGDVPSLDADGAVSAGIDAALVDRNGRLDPTHGAMRDLNPLPRLVASGSVNGILVRTARTGS